MKKMTSIIIASLLGATFSWSQEKKIQVPEADITITVNAGHKETDRETIKRKEAEEKVAQEQKRTELLEIRRQKIEEAERIGAIKDKEYIQIQKYQKDELVLKSLQFRKESATNGLPSSQYRLGVNYLNGTDGVSTNKDLAVYWLKKSARQGNADSISELEKLFPNNYEFILKSNFSN